MVHHHDQYCIYDGRMYRYMNRYPAFTAKTAQQTKRADTITLPELDPDYCSYCNHYHPWTGHKWLCALEGCKWSSWNGERLHVPLEQDRPKRPNTDLGKALKIAELTMRMIGRRR